MKGVFQYSIKKKVRSNPRVFLQVFLQFYYIFITIRMDFDLKCLISSYSGPCVIF